MDWLTPGDPDALSELLAERRDDDRPVLPTGADTLPPALVDATGDPGGSIAVVSTASLAGLRELRPRDLTVAAGAGTRVPELLTALAEEGVWVPLGGPALGMSVGGLAAAAPAGPFDGSYGDLKRQLLACGLVGWDGRELRWGRAVMKDVAGYSMVRSVTGSYGRTGVVHRTTFRLWPAPETLALSELTGEGDADPLRAAAALATSDADASVRPDAAVWSRSPHGPEGGRLEVRLVGSEASVALRLEKLRAWADGRGLELDGDEPAAFDPLVAGGGIRRAASPGGDPTGAAGTAGEASGAPGPAPGLPAAGGSRDPAVSLLAVRTGRGGFRETARRIRRVLGDRAVAMEGYPLAGRLRCAYRRAPDARTDATAASTAPAAFRELADAVGGAPVRVERGSSAEIAAADGRRSEGARRLEARVEEELAGRPRHWMSAYL